eukprot:scaffold41232_cov66-Phaeocystis_antarctica.AAC.9
MASTSCAAAPPTKAATGESEPCAPCAKAATRASSTLSWGSRPEERTASSNASPSCGGELPSAAAAVAASAASMEQKQAWTVAARRGGEPTGICASASRASAVQPRGTASHSGTNLCSCDVFTCTRRPPLTRTLQLGEAHAVAIAQPVRLLEHRAHDNAPLRVLGHRLQQRLSHRLAVRVGRGEGLAQVGEEAAEDAAAAAAHEAHARRARRLVERQLRLQRLVDRHHARVAMRLEGRRVDGAFQAAHLDVRVERR